MTRGCPQTRTRAESIADHYFGKIRPKLNGAGLLPGYYRYVVRITWVFFEVVFGVILVSDVLGELMVR